MDLKITRAARIGGMIDVPGNKSISHRAAIFGALASGTTRISGFLRADDTRATLGILRVLGVEIQDDSSGDVVVNGVGWDGLRAPQSALDCGNSGTTMRLMSGVLAGCAFESVLAGDASLSKRPMDRVRVPLSQMGAQISGQGDNCLPPLQIQSGNLHGIEYHSPVASAQVKSAILLAGLRAKGETIVIEPSPSRDHTERMLNAFGATVWERKQPHRRVRWTNFAWDGCAGFGRYFQCGVFSGCGRVERKCRHGAQRRHQSDAHGNY